MQSKKNIGKDNKCFAEEVLINLSKAFDTMNHQLLLAKLHALWIQQTSFSYNM